MTATIKGHEALLRKLTMIPQQVRGSIRDAMALSADEIVEMMERLVPQDQGDLFASIGWQWGSQAPKGSVAIGQVQGGDEGDEELTLTIFAGNDTDAFHARWIEFGTRKMRKQPFFFVSYRANRKNARRRIRTAVNRAARKVAAGG